MLPKTCPILLLSRFPWVCFTGRMGLDELRTLLAQRARPDMTTSVPGAATFPKCAAIASA